jgi:ubiquinone/menaquinone biosynthesis C-methylase UbiE
VIDPIPKNKIYDTLPPGLYYDAITKGDNIQRFWHRQKFDAALNKIDFNKTESVLDVGCGPGILLSKILKKVSVTIGMDISKNQVNFTRNLLNNDNNIVGTAQKIPVKDNVLDCVFMIEVLEHLSPQEADSALKSIYNALNRGGIFILTTPNYRSLWPIIEFFWNKINPINYNEQHINKQNIDKLRRSLLNARFKNITIETIFTISPFFSLISEKLALRVLGVEKKIIPSIGSLIIVKAEK